MDLLLTLIYSSLSFGRLEMFALAFFTFSTGAFSGDWCDISAETWGGISSYLDDLAASMLVGTYCGCSYGSSKGFSAASKSLLCAEGPWDKLLDLGTSCTVWLIACECSSTLGGKAFVLEAELCED